jgi:uncharacterized membrane protein
MSTGDARSPRLESLLARLLYYGTWLACAVIALGLVLAFAQAGFGPGNGATPFGMRVVTAGVALFILLPVVRVAVMLFVFARERDYRFMTIAALVLAIIVVGFLVGVYTSGSAAADRGERTSETSVPQ